MAIKLDNILIDGRNIHANLPKFERTKIAEKHVFRGGRFGGLRASPLNHHAAKEKSYAVGSKSFTRVVGNVKHRKGMEEAFYMCYFSEDEDKVRLKKEFVGEVINPGMFYKI